MVKAAHSVEYFGVIVKVEIVQITRGIGSTIDYRTSVWPSIDGFEEIIPDGELLVPPQVIHDAKTALWLSLKP